MALTDTAFTARDLQTGADVYSETADAATAGERKFLVVLGDGTGGGDDPDLDAGTIEVLLTIDGAVCAGGTVSVSKEVCTADTPVRLTLGPEKIVSGDTVAINVKTSHASDGAVKVAVFPYSAEADLMRILGTKLTETSGQIAARFANYFDQDAAGYNVKTALSAFKAATTGIQLAADQAVNITKWVGTAVTRSDLGQDNTIYVAKDGNDGNDGLTRGQAVLTIGQAITNASSGWSIKIAPGTYSETVDTSALTDLHIKGSGWGTIITSASATTLTTGARTTIESLRVISTKAATSGDMAMTVGADAVVRQVFVTGNSGGLETLSGDMWVLDCVVNAAEYGVSGFNRLHVLRSRIICSGWDVCCSAAITCPGGGAIISDTYIYADCATGAPSYATGVLCYGYSSISNCTIYARGTNGSHAYALKVPYTNYITCVQGGVARSYTVGGGDSYGIHQTAGTIAVCGLLYETSSGTVTQLLPTVDASGNAHADMKLLKTAEADQAIADALKLAPTAGDPAVGSLNKHADDILEDTNETQTDWHEGGRLDLLLDSVLSRLGAWTGTGVNTVLGAFKAILSKVALLPSDIGGTGDPAADSVEALRERGDAAWITAVGFVSQGLGGVETNIKVEVEGVLIEGAEVWITSDEDGTVFIAGPLETDVLGVTGNFMLEDDSGPFYVWRQKGGYNISNSTTIVWSDEDSKYIEEA